MPVKEPGLFSEALGMLFEVLGMSFEVLGMLFEVKFDQSQWVFTVF